METEERRAAHACVNHQRHRLRGHPRDKRGPRMLFAVQWRLVDNEFVAFMDDTFDNAPSCVARKDLPPRNQIDSTVGWPHCPPCRSFSEDVIRRHSRWIAERDCP